MGLEEYASHVIETVREKNRSEHLGLRISLKNEIPQYIYGKQAEEMISGVIRQEVPQIELIDDVYMDLSGISNPISGYFPTMQIDHVGVSDHAVYVFEIKYFRDSALLSGTAYTKNWEYKDSFTKKSTRENADRQNQYHVDNIRRILKLDEHVRVVSIVCLVGIKPENIKLSTEYGKYIVTAEELPLYLTLFENKYNREMIEKESIMRSINRLNIKSFETEVNHIIWVKLLKKRLRETSKGKRKRKKK